MNTRKNSWPSSLTVEQRIDLAKERTSKIIDHVRHLIALNESNAILNYSKDISGQIPRSYAAHAFALLQDSQHRYEIMRLCALWDKPGENRESIPTIAALIDDPDVIAALVKETEGQWGWDKLLQDSGDPDTQTHQELEEAYQASERRLGQRMGKRALRWMSSASKFCARVTKCERFQLLVALRDTHLAHNLDGETANMRGSNKSRYGDEKWLLELTIRVSARYYLGICGTDFAMEQSREIARKQAKMFWGGVKIQVLG